MRPIIKLLQSIIIIAEIIEINGENMDVSGVSSAMASAYASSGASGSAGDAGGVGVSILKDAIDMQGDMAMRLIEANMQLSMQQQKMGIASEIIAANQVDVYA